MAKIRQVQNVAQIKFLDVQYTYIASYKFVHTNILSLIHVDHTNTMKSRVWYSAFTTTNSAITTIIVIAAILRIWSMTLLESSAVTMTG